MSAQVQLDRPYDHFTNLDFVTGRVILQLPRDETITSVVVKLEGESKTKLEGPRTVHSMDRQDRIKAELEVHKLLYKVLTVFPSPGIKSSPASSGYTLKAGQHSYPFEFKIPFNNDCSESNSAYTNLNFAGLRMEMARDTNLHVKRTLPPSLNGFPGRAEIRYYVKATIARPSFYKENYRSHADIKFLPIEPPRMLQQSAAAAGETYARRHFEYANLPTPTSKIKGLFGSIHPSTPPSPPAEPPRITIDARLPSPAIITCNEPLPLRLLVRKESDFSKSIHLQSLQIELIAYTKIRAHEFNRTESGSWVLSSLSNINTPIGREADPIGTEWVLNSSPWDRTPLPNTVAPAFETCNISRYYELEARVGLTYGRLGTPQSQLTVHPLRMPVLVYSGIAPPPTLLSRMAESHSTPPPFTPSSGAIVDAPPSYEDAMAIELAPVDGPRRQYAQANAPGPSGFGDDPKMSASSPHDYRKVV